ncbi:hypothetical protein RND81_02G112100 [Saponaria officinalis]|uniref:Prolamin-like domain-containing protein n=1 Tax=Saponaria officinalis TaxID=3572 RepID=A0AAW1MU18_SAPOF
MNIHYIQSHNHHSHLHLKNRLHPPTTVEKPVKMKATIVILAFLTIPSLTYAQEQQQQAVVTPQWFIPHPFIIPPHVPLPPFPSLPPMSAPGWPFKHPTNPPPAHDNLGPCADDLRSFLSTHKFEISSACCSVLKGVKIPPVQKLVTQYCSGGSPSSN